MKQIYTKNVHKLPIFFVLQVKVEGRTQFLTVVCMGCLEGVNGRAIICRFCNQKWDGSSLVLGTMYSYDIFAAMPCCTERIKVSIKKHYRFIFPLRNSFMRNAITVSTINRNTYLLYLFFQCNACYKPVLHPAQRLNFFSDYSHMVPCPHCRTLDTHFVKPLGFCYSRLVSRSLQMWP